MSKLTVVIYQAGVRIMPRGEKTMASKSFLLSKTFWLNGFAMLALAVPATSGFIQEYFTEFGMGWGLINLVLRMISKDKLEIGLK